jgi:hypothetical protein
MTTLAELTAENASIEQQMNEWRQQRYANGEDPMDWLAFRAHVILIGAPDPGVSPPDEFHRWDESMHGGESKDEVQSAPQTTVTPDAQPHSFGKPMSEVNTVQADRSATTDDSATWPAEAGAGSKTSNWSSDDERDNDAPQTRSAENVRPEGQ